MLVAMTAQRRCEAPTTPTGSSTLSSSREHFAIP
jgi:hypothetical protein